MNVYVCVHLIVYEEQREEVSARAIGGKGQLWERNRETRLVYSRGKQPLLYVPNSQAAISANRNAFPTDDNSEPFSGQLL